jgi:hypothetical protein
MMIDLQLLQLGYVASKRTPFLLCSLIIHLAESGCTSSLTHGGRDGFKRSSSGGQTRRRGGFPNAALRRRSFYCWRAILPHFWHVALTECKNQSSRSAFALSPLVIWAVLSLLCLPCSQIPLPLQYLQKLFCLQQGFFFGNQSHVTFCTVVTLSQVVNTSRCISPSDIYIYIYIF